MGIAVRNFKLNCLSLGLNNMHNLIFIIFKYFDHNFLRIYVEQCWLVFGKKKGRKQQQRKGTVVFLDFVNPFLICK